MSFDVDMDEFVALQKEVFVLRAALKDAQREDGVSGYSEEHMRQRQQIVSGWMREMEALVELRKAAEGAEAKLRDEYHQHRSDAPLDESWAEGERLRNALDDLNAVLGEWRPEAD